MNLLKLRNWISLAISSVCYRTVWSTSCQSSNIMKPLQIGLTGSIGMGKSTVTNHLRSLGFPVFDADKAVHDLYGKGGKAVSALQHLFPEAIVEGAVSRPILASRVLQDASALKTLESIVHPLVAAERIIFFENATKNGDLAVVYDIPLLLENRLNYDVDYVVVVTASAETQKARVMMRPGMTLEKFQSILAKQMPDAQKRELADFVINTDFPGRVQAKAQVAQMLESVIQARPLLWDAWKRRRPLSCPSPSSGTDLTSIISQHFDAVAFDLDETLTQTWAPIDRAIEQMCVYMDQHMPRTAPLARLNCRSAMQRVAEQQPLLKHDFVSLREEALRMLCRESGADEELDRVGEAMQVFVEVRSSLDSYLFPDALPLLRYLSEIPNLKLLMMTNGMADLKYSPELSRYISSSFIAGNIGAAKPSVVPFIAMAQVTCVCPSRVLYVGDSFANDVVGSKATGLCAAWLNRSEDDVCVDGVQPDFVLNSLDVVEFEAKIRDWIRRQN